MRDALTDNQLYDENDDETLLLSASTTVRSRHLASRDDIDRSSIQMTCKYAARTS